MAISVQYDSGSLVPAPMVSVNKEYAEAGDGEILGSIFNITLNGVIVKPLTGSESDSSRLNDILTAQKDIRDIFAQNEGANEGSGGTGAGGTLTISHGADSTSYVGCHVKSIAFEGGSPREVSLNQLGFYTVNLTCTHYDADDDTFTYNVSDVSETWEVEEATDFKDLVISGSSVNISKAYRVSHNISATGKPKYSAANTLDTDGLAWQQARLYVLNRLKVQAAGSNTPPTGGKVTTGHQIVATDILDTDATFVNKNHVRTQSVDEKVGSFSVTETFVLVESDAPENVIEEIEISISQAPSENGRTSISLNGTITGFNTTGPLSSSEDAYNNALSYFATIDTADNLNYKTRAANLSGTSLTLNSRALSKSISRNPVAGTVSYTIEFDDRPSNCVSSALSESIVITDVHPGHLFGSVNAIGRGIKGPVLQWLGCGTESKRTLTLELVVPTPAGDCPSPITTKPSLDTTYSADIEAIIDSAVPSSTAGKLFYSAPRESWDVKNGRYTLEMEWTYEYSALAIFNPQLT